MARDYLALYERILAERRMLKRPVGALTLGCAAIDDITAWFLIALATTVAVAGSFGEVAKTIGEAALFIVVMWFGVRPIIARLSTAFDEVGRIPGGWLVAIFAGVLVSAYITETINIAVPARDGLEAGRIRARPAEPERRADGIHGERRAVRRQYRRPCDVLGGASQARYRVEFRLVVPRAAGAVVRLERALDVRRPVRDAPAALAARGLRRTGKHHRHEPHCDRQRRAHAQSSHVSPLHIIAARERRATTMQDENRGRCRACYTQGGVGPRALTAASG